MNRPRLTITEDHLEALRRLVLCHPACEERAALLLLAPVEIGKDPWTGQSARRLLSRAVVSIPEEDVLSASGDHITTSTRPLARSLAVAAKQGLVVCYVHSHPHGVAVFSEQDDDGEGRMAHLAHNRNGDGTEFASLLLAGDGRLAARIWRHPTGFVPMESITVIGDRIAIRWEALLTASPEAFHRQALAFGDALYADIASLRIGIVGGGATGSATAMLIGRLGGRRIALFDPDVIDVTNLNRLHGATIDDALASRPKVAMLRGMLEGFGLGAEVVTVGVWAGNEDARDVLKSCDVIFGCTDDHDGRALLNRLAYVYSIPVFDMGIRIDPRGPGLPVRGAVGRVTVIQPGTRCLLCRGVIDVVRAREEQIERTDPEEYERQRVAGYITGQTAPNPAVVQFTTDVACMATDELVQRLTGYRSAGSSNHRVRQFHALEDRNPGPVSSGPCPICQVEDNWSKGDTLHPFLGRIG
jgi:molybdopterin/thiamine biosynthesis adenylyltransferase